ncbi:unnamed protein product [Trifolium pratense]|uniref:Uncharacterized protein n=1 Tax=Trifolium pratense TaxID=57577 RepID=A0ACB0LN11_TRIPR|nr:unnamed protein product [Trifolium pratense]
MDAPKSMSRRRKYSEGTRLVGIFLPHELITQILSFLPVKHLMQLKCVCKSWKTLISNDSTLVKLHLKRSAKRVALFSFTCNKSRKLCSVRFPKVSFEKGKEPKQKLTDAFGAFLYPVGCCNGLLCLVGYYLTNDHHAEIWLYLYNPATKTFSNKIVFLSKPRAYYLRFGIIFRFQHGWKFAFGYDNSTDTYKIVAFCLLTNEVRVFNFGDNVWRNIQSFPVVPVDRGGFPSDEQCHPGINNGVYVNVSGTLNWLSIQNNFEYKNEIDWKHITIDQFVIISLDLSTETYLQLLPPSDFDKLPCLQPTLVVLMDCLCLSFSHGFDGTDFIIWQMKEFGVQESWTQLLKISYRNLRSLMSYDYESLLFPVCVSGNGDTLILAWGKSNEKAILCTLSDNSVKKSRKFTNEIRWYLAKDYVESLVSID